MSKPIGANIGDGALGQPNSDVVQAKFGPSTQFTGAELVASKYGVTRERLRGIVARQAAATADGIFADEIIAVDGRTKEGEHMSLTADEGIRKGTTAEKLSHSAAAPADCARGASPRGMRAR